MIGFFAPAGVVLDAPERLAQMIDGCPTPRVGDARGRWLFADAPLVVIEGPTPVWSRDRSVCVVFDGRLDNVEDIGGASSASDAQRVADLLSSDRRRLGTLVGDFVLAAWWPGESRLWIARDALGARPCYYAVSDRTVFWGNTLESVRRGTARPARVNEALFAEFLASAPASLEETPLHDIHRLPPAQCLDITPSGHVRRTFWTLDVTDEHHQSPEEALDQFRALFVTAVRARLRQASSPCFQLSGGLDSSSVVGVATHVCGVSRPATYSLVYPERPPADESDYIRDVELFCGAEGVHHEVRARRAVGLDVFAGAVQWGDLPEVATGEYITGAMMRRAAAAGHDVMFTGLGGDDWLTGSRFRMAALLRRGRVFAAWRFAGEYRSIPWLDPGARAMWRAGVLPNVPTWVKRAARRVRGPAPLPPWLCSEFAARVGLDDRMQAAFRRAPDVAHPVVRESLVRVGSGDSVHVREAVARTAANAGIDLRHPFYDRRLVAFLVALPDDLRMRDHVHRWIQRTALAKELPPRVAARLDKPELDAVVVDALQAIEPETLWHDLRVVDRGWVAREIVIGLWPAARRAPSTNALSDWRAAFGLWQVFAAEALVRALEATSHARPDSRAVVPLARCASH